ncbi:MAG: hypothetical protein FWC26_10295 [Fibromonadales bacterium]|nr:hypothetical protein [Fibromonadales bacterium]
MQDHRVIAANLLIKVDDLGLSVRAGNVMRRCGIDIVADLVRYTEAEIKKSWGLGKTTWKELTDLVSSMGLQWGFDIEACLKETGSEFVPGRIDFAFRKAIWLDCSAGYQAVAKKLLVDIGDLGLSDNTSSILKLYGIHTVGELVHHTENELFRLIRCNIKALRELNELLYSKGLCWGVLMFRFIKINDNG